MLGSAKTLLVFVLTFGDDEPTTPTPFFAILIIIICHQGEGETKKIIKEEGRKKKII